LREGDVILAFGPQPVAGVDDLHRLLTELQVGTRNSITVLRGTDRVQLAIVPQESNQ
jgi:S1-C subfamily serine protease